MTLSEALSRLRPLDTAAMDETQGRLNRILKPLDSLGRLESHLVQIGGITGKADFDFSRKTVVVFCADNGVVAQGISQSGQEVTARVARNLTTGDTCVCAMSRVAGAEVLPVDIGIAAKVDFPGIRLCKVAWGTKDFSVEPAMTRTQAIQAIEVGIRLAEELKTNGCGLAATGEMGIGNTTTTAALAAVLLNRPVTEVTGRGAGISSAGYLHKIRVIESAIALHRPTLDDPVGLLSALGGFDIAGMAGLCIGGAVFGLPIVLDGVISCVAAALACAIAPEVRNFLLPSHLPAEPAGRLLLETLGLHPLLDGGLHLGEGTGAVATFPLYDMILEVYTSMISFEEEGIPPYEPFHS